MEGGCITENLHTHVQSTIKKRVADAAMKKMVDLHCVVEAPCPRVHACKGRATTGKKGERTQCR